MSDEQLKWDQVIAWRLERHCLSPRLPEKRLIEAVQRTGGIQTQVMSAAELALWARVEGLTREDIQSALWKDNTLVKTWAMRGTLHIIPADELPLYVSALSTETTRNWLKFFIRYGVSKDEYERYMAEAPQVLLDGPLTREEFATAIAKQTGLPKLEHVIKSRGWGTPLKPLAWNGELCFGPNNGQNVTFINPRKLIGDWEPIEPKEALKELIRRYLDVYGPNRPENFARWWFGGGGVRFAKTLFNEMADELVSVDVEGWEAYATKSSLRQIGKADAPDSVNLLPSFDSYTFGFGRDLEPMLAKEHETIVFRPQGWVSSVVLVDGCIEGIWEYKNQGGKMKVKVRMFSSIEDSLKRRIEAEVERLGDFLKVKPKLIFDG